MTCKPALRIGACNSTSRGVSARQGCTGRVEIPALPLSLYSRQLRALIVIKRPAAATRGSGCKAKANG